MAKKRGYIVRVHGAMTQAVRARMTGGPAGGVRPEYGGAWEAKDSEGKPFFRVVAIAESGEEARTLVRARLDGLDVEIGAADLSEFPGVRGGRADISRRAIEHYVVEMMSAIAAEEERVQRAGSGREPAYIISPLRLVGSYPDTMLEVGTYNRALDERSTHQWPLWSDSNFVAATERFDSLNRWIADFLMYRRGG